VTWLGKEVAWDSTSAGCRRPPRGMPEARKSAWRIWEGFLMKRMVPGMLWARVTCPGPRVASRDLANSGGEGEVGVGVDISKVCERVYTGNRK